MGDIHILFSFSNGCLKGDGMGIGYFNNKLNLLHKSVFITKQTKIHLIFFVYFVYLQLEKLLYSNYMEVFSIINI